MTRLTKDLRESIPLPTHAALLAAALKLPEVAAMEAGNG